MLVCGQHRIKGTRELGNIPFLVTAMPGAPWPELAFQFIVTNRTGQRGRTRIDAESPLEEGG